jgi:hypothetical protein
MRKLHVIAPAFVALALSVAVQANAQGTLSDRIARVRDGVVRVQYESRSGVCGNGKNLVSYRSAMFSRDFTGFGPFVSRCSWRAAE